MIIPIFSARLLLAVLLLFTSSCLAKTKHSNKSCKTLFDCQGSGSRYYRCCIGGSSRYCSTWKYCNGFCTNPTYCGVNEFCVDGYCSKNAGPGTLYCASDQDCFNANIDYEKYVECYVYRCLPSKCRFCPTSCKNGECERAKSEDEGHSFSPASIIGFTAVVLIGSCIACTLYCGCGRRRQQPARTPAAREVANERQERGTPPPSPPLHPDAPPPYDSLEMIDRIQVEPPPPSYAEAVRNSQSNIENV